METDEEDGSSNTDKMKEPPSDGPFVVRAYIARDETIEPGYTFPQPMSQIYQRSPPQARYAVVTYDNKPFVIDIYESTVATQEPFVMPKFIDRKFQDVDHAIATMRIAYGEDRGNSKLLMGRLKLRSAEREFNEEFDKFSKF